MELYLYIPLIKIEIATEMNNIIMVYKFYILPNHEIVLFIIIVYLQLKTEVIACFVR